jgi:hypothetical protein
MDVPLVVLLAQLPVPVDTGDWNFSPPAPVTTWPAWTVPDAGEPA